MPKEASFDWVCSRRLVSEDDGDSVLVRIARPRRRGKGEWSCRIEIAGQSEFAFGLDSVQALTVALQMVRLKLQHDDRRLRWAGGEDGDHGFEMHVPRIFGLAKTLEIEGLVSEALADISAAAEKRHRGRKSSP